MGTLDVISVFYQLNQTSTKFTAINYFSFFLFPDACFDKEINKTVYAPKVF